MPFFDLKKFFDKCTQDQPDIIGISMGFSHPNIAKMPQILASAVNCPTFVFLEVDNQKYRSILSACEARYKISSRITSHNLWLKIRHCLDDGKDNSNWGSSTSSKGYNYKSDGSKGSAGSSYSVDRGEEEDDGSIVIKGSGSKKSGSQGESGLRPMSANRGQGGGYKAKQAPVMERDYETKSESDPHFLNSRSKKNNDLKKSSAEDLGNVTSQQSQDKPGRGKNHSQDKGQSSPLSAHQKSSPGGHNPAGEQASQKKTSAAAQLKSSSSSGSKIEDGQAKISQPLKQESKAKNRDEKPAQQKNHDKEKSHNTENADKRSTESKPSIDYQEPTSKKNQNQNADLKKDKAGEQKDKLEKESRRNQDNQSDKEKQNKSSVSPKKSKKTKEEKKLAKRRKAKLKSLKKRKKQKKNEIRDEVAQNILLECSQNSAKSLLRILENQENKESDHEKVSMLLVSVGQAKGVMIIRSDEDQVIPETWFDQFRHHLLKKLPRQ